MDSWIEKDSKNQNISLLHLIYSCFGQCFWFSIHLCRCFVRSESKIGGSRFLGMSVITSFMKLSWKAPTRGLEKGVKISGDTQILKILMVLIYCFSMHFVGDMPESVKRKPSSELFLETLDNGYCHNCLSLTTQQKSSPLDCKLLSNGLVLFTQLVKVG